MKKSAFVLLLAVSLFLEALMTTIPLVLIILLISYITHRNLVIFPVALVMGILLDVYLVRTIGVTSLFFVLYLFLIASYERKFETQTTQFVLFSSFLGTVAFFSVFNKTENILLYAGISSTLALLQFAIAKRIN